MWCFWTIDNICEKLLYIFSPQFLQWLLTPHIRMTAVLGWPLLELRWIFALILWKTLRGESPLFFGLKLSVSGLTQMLKTSQTAFCKDAETHGFEENLFQGRPWQQTCHKAWNNTQTVPPDGHQCTPVQSQWEKNTRSPCLLQTAKNKRTDGKRRYITNTSGLGERKTDLFLCTRWLSLCNKDLASLSQSRPFHVHAP